VRDLTRNGRIVEVARPIWRKLRGRIHRFRVGIAKKTARINRRPVIVLGVQKSGTTAVAMLMGKAAGMSVTSDFIHLNSTMEYQKELYRTRAFRDLVRRNRYYFARDIIKEPDLTFFIEELLIYFPLGRFIFLVRDPRDNIRSILNRVNLPGRPIVPDQEHWRGLQNGDSWQMIVEGGLPLISGDTYIEKLAKRWKLAAELYLKHADRIRLFRYEDFLQDKVKSITTLLSDLGLKVRHSIEDSIDIQYQPRGNREITWETFFGRDSLQRIEAICTIEMARFGYRACQPNACINE
jgi:Sulfotransferase family